MFNWFRKKISTRSNQFCWSDLPPEVKETLQFRRKYVRSIEHQDRIEVILDRDGEQGTMSFLWDPIKEQYVFVRGTGF